MTQPISSVSGTPALRLPAPVASSESVTAGQFNNLLLNSLEQLQSLDQTATAKIESSLLGNQITQAEVLSAVKKADLALKMMLQIRNKILESYKEVQQMQL